MVAAGLCALGAQLGPAILVTCDPLAPSTGIHIAIQRAGSTVFTGSTTLAEMKRDMAETFGERATMHAFAAVVAPEHASRLPDGEKLHILEVFARDASKWSALKWIAGVAGVPLGRVCAIGDEINDVPMKLPHQGPPPSTVDVSSNTRSCPGAGLGWSR